MMHADLWDQYEFDEEFWKMVTLYGNWKLPFTKHNLLRMQRLDAKKRHPGS